MSCTVQTLKATDGSTYSVVCTFDDETGASVIPNTITWSLLDANGDAINSRSGVSVTPAESVTIVLSGEDIQQENGKYMYLTLKGTYDSTLGTDLPIVSQTRIEICEIIE